MGAFCLPLGVVLFVYWKIYKAAKLRVGPRQTNSVSPISETVQVGVKGSLKKHFACVCTGLFSGTPSPTLVRSGKFLVFWGKGGEEGKGVKWERESITHSALLTEHAIAHAYLFPHMYEGLNYRILQGSTRLENSVDL